jgi:hypothetical protein
MPDSSVGRSTYPELGQSRDEKGVCDVSHAGQDDSLELAVLCLQEPADNRLTEHRTLTGFL